MSRYEDLSSLNAVLAEAARLVEDGPWEEAAALYEGVVERYGDDEELSVRIAVARTMVHRAYLLAEHHRRERAIAADDEVVKRFGEVDELELREAVAARTDQQGRRA